MIHHGVDVDRTTEENFASLPSPTLPERTVEENFANLPDEDIAKVRKRVRSARRTDHIENTCILPGQDNHLKRIIIERRDAIDKEKTRMERKCEAAPGPFAVPVHVPIRITASDIGCELIFWAPNSDASVGTGHDHQWGFLESVSWRTIRPSDGSPAWKARIFAVRTTFIHRNGLETQKLCGVHETRIISVVPGHH